MNDIGYTTQTKEPFSTPLSLVRIVDGGQKNKNINAISRDGVQRLMPSAIPKERESRKSNNNKKTVNLGLSTRGANEEKEMQKCPPPRMSCPKPTQTNDDDEWIPL